MANVFRAFSQATAEELVSSDTVDRRVHVSVTGPEVVFIGFSSTQVTDGSEATGYPVTSQGVTFILAAGEALWARGRNVATTINIMITKGV
jgi:hypothetical protein